MVICTLSAGVRVIPQRHDFFRGWDNKVHQRGCEIMRVEVLYYSSIRDGRVFEVS